MYINNSLYRNDIERIICDEFSTFRGKRFLITGASGLVGSCIVDSLLYLNEKYNFNIKVLAVFSNPHSFENRFPSYKGNKDFTVIVHDITYPFECDIEADFIIHAASNTHPQLYTEKPVETIGLNVLGTLNLLNVAKDNPSSKVLFLSTFEVYGENENIRSLSESDIGVLDFMVPRACYPESKRVCETLCHSFVKEYEADVVIARLGYVYGPTVKLNSSKADVQFLNNALCQEPIVMKSAGMQQRSYIYVFDVASALLTLLLKGGSGETYNIASESGNILLKDFAIALSKISDVKIRSEIPTGGGKFGVSTILNSTLNNAKLLSLGWRTKFSLEAGIRHTYEIKKEIMRNA